MVQIQLLQYLSHQKEQKSKNIVKWHFMKILFYAKSKYICKQKISFRHAHWPNNHKVLELTVLVFFGGDSFLRFCFEITKKKSTVR